MYFFRKDDSSGIRLLGILVLILCFNILRSQDITHFKEAKSSVRGKVSATLIGYNANGIQPRKDPFSYVLAANVTVNLKGFVFPFSFVYSNRNSRFSQPFNQFGISPRWKWITLHLGYRNINFSRYVLGGHTILGGGIELTPGLFRFGFVYGRLQRKVNKAVKINDPTADTIASFNRKMFSVKIGVGNKDSFFDLIFLKASDDSTSLDTTSGNSGVLPAANVVGGFNSKIKFSPSFRFEAEGAYSIYTDNQGGKAIEGVSPTIGKYFPVNISTHGYLALKARLTYTAGRNFRIGLSYRRIDPGFKSMGTYFINNDLQNITLDPAFSLFKRKLRFHGSVGMEMNNLKNERNATTKKIIGSASLTYQPVRVFGINASYANYSINQKNGRVQISDSVKIYQSNSNLMIMPYFNRAGSRLSHFLSLVFTNMNLNDKNPVTQDLTNFTLFNLVLSYNMGLLKSGFSINTSINYNRVNMSTGASTNKGVTLGFSKALWKSKLNLSLFGTVTQSENIAQTALIINPVFMANLRIAKHHHFRLKLLYTSNKNQTDSSKTYSEQIGDFSYAYTF